MSYLFTTSQIATLDMSLIPTSDKRCLHCGCDSRKSENIDRRWAIVWQQLYCIDCFSRLDLWVKLQADHMTYGMALQLLKSSLPSKLFDQFEYFSLDTSIDKNLFMPDSSDFIAYATRGNSEGFIVNVMMVGKQGKHLPFAFGKCWSLQLANFVVSTITRYLDGQPGITHGDATFISEVTVTDPDSNAPVEIAIYKDSTSGGLFGIDSSYITQEEPDSVPSPFNSPDILNLVEA